MEIRTGYFAHTKKYESLGYKCINIARIKPKWFIGDSLLELAPSLDLLERYKSGTITEEQYESEYLQHLERIDIHKLFDRFSEDAKLVLLCYEKSSSFCHRHILAKYLSKSWGMSISELNL